MLASRSITLSRPNYGHHTDTAEKVAQQARRLLEALASGAVFADGPRVYPLANVRRAPMATWKVVRRRVLLCGSLRAPPALTRPSKCATTRGFANPDNETRPQVPRSDAWSTSAAPI